MRHPEARLHVRAPRLLAVAEAVAVEVLAIDCAGQPHSADNGQLPAADFGFVAGKELWPPQPHIAGREHYAVVVDDRADRREGIPLLAAKDPEVAPLHLEVSLQDS